MRHLNKFRFIALLLILPHLALGATGSATSSSSSTSTSGSSSTKDKNKDTAPPKKEKDKSSSTYKAQEVKATAKAAEVKAAAKAAAKAAEAKAAGKSASGGSSGSGYSSPISESLNTGSPIYKDKDIDVTIRPPTYTKQQVAQEKSKVTALEAQVTTTTNEKNKTTTNIATVKTNITNANTKVTALTNDKAKAKAANAAVTTENSNLDQQKSKMKSKQAELLAQIQNTNAKTKEFKDKSAKNKAETEKIKSDENSKKSKLESLKAEEKNLKEAKDKSQAAYEALKSQKKKADEKLRLANERRLAAEKAAADLAAKIADKKNRPPVPPLPDPVDPGTTNGKPSLADSCNDKEKELQNKKVLSQEQIEAYKEYYAGLWAAKLKEPDKDLLGLIADGEVIRAELYKHALTSYLLNGIDPMLGIFGTGTTYATSMTAINTVVGNAKDRAPASAPQLTAEQKAKITQLYAQYAADRMKGAAEAKAKNFDPLNEIADGARIKRDLYRYALSNYIAHDIDPKSTVWSRGPMEQFVLSQGVDGDSQSAFDARYLDLITYTHDVVAYPPGSKKDHLVPDVQMSETQMLGLKTATVLYGPDLKAFELYSPSHFDPNSYSAGAYGIATTQHYSMSMPGGVIAIPVMPGAGYGADGKPNAALLETQSTFLHESNHAGVNALVSIATAAYWANKGAWPNETFENAYNFANAVQVDGANELFDIGQSMEYVDEWGRTRTFTFRASDYLHSANEILAFSSELNGKEWLATTIRHDHPDLTASEAAQFADVLYNSPTVVYYEENLNALASAMTPEMLAWVKTLPDYSNHLVLNDNVSGKPLSMKPCGCANSAHHAGGQ